eukprot:TRINITY_DN5445_c0_g1_i1.p1 TRINITY_DN5445_c0_g1~~TRINITY_DN5445_c0_g1_i1.p1  ORF type:complete len:215 (+),score=77.61 TRINITY_DN5445_c0_g1_i1:186-830(+)
MSRQDEIWDDSVLVDAYKSAVEGYKRSHATSKDFVQDSSSNSSKRAKISSNETSNTAQKEGELNGNRSESNGKRGENHSNQLQKNGQIETLNEGTENVQWNEEEQNIDHQQYYEQQSHDGYSYYQPNQQNHYPSYYQYPPMPPMPPFPYYPLPFPRRKCSNHSKRKKNEGDEVILPPPLPPHIENDPVLANLLNSWYESGYRAGYYQATKENVK